MGSAYRKHYRVILDGRDPFDIVTSALDWAQAEADPAASRPMDMAFQVIWHACRRLGVQGVPERYRDFLDVLDDFDDLSDPDQADPVLPIRATA